MVSLNKPEFSCWPPHDTQTELSPRKMKRAILFSALVALVFGNDYFNGNDYLDNIDDNGGFIGGRVVGTPMIGRQTIGAGIAGIGGIRGYPYPGHIGGGLGGIDNIGIGGGVIGGGIAGIGGIRGGRIGGIGGIGGIGRIGDVGGIEGIGGVGSIGGIGGFGGIGGVGGIRHNKGHYGKGYYRGQRRYFLGGVLQRNMGIGGHGIYPSYEEFNGGIIGGVGGIRGGVQGSFGGYPRHGGLIGGSRGFGGLGGIDGAGIGGIEERFIGGGSYPNYGGMSFNRKGYHRSGYKGGYKGGSY